MGIPDTPEVALRDWLRFGELDRTTPGRWPGRGTTWSARGRRCTTGCAARGLRFLPAVNWVERGRYGEGNSLPRYHIVWGTARELVLCLGAALQRAGADGRLHLLHRHRVLQLDTAAGRLCGAGARRGPWRRGAAARRWWCWPWAASTATTPSAAPTGRPIVRCRQRCSTARTLRRRRPITTRPTPSARRSSTPARCGTTPRGFHTRLRISPDTACRSSPASRRCGWTTVASASVPSRWSPASTPTGCASAWRSRPPWTWHLLNWRIAAKEFAISGAEHNPRIRDKQFLRFSPRRCSATIAWCGRCSASEDFLVDATLSGLAARMNALTASHRHRCRAPAGHGGCLRRAVRPRRRPSTTTTSCAAFCTRASGGRIACARPNRLLQQRGAGPFIAIRVQLVTRKSLAACAPTRTVACWRRWCGRAGPVQRGRGGRLRRRRRQRQALAGRHLPFGCISPRVAARAIGAGGWRGRHSRQRGRLPRARSPPPAALPFDYPTAAPARADAAANAAAWARLAPASACWWIGSRWTPPAACSLARLRQPLVLAPVAWLASWRGGAAKCKRCAANAAGVPFTLSTVGLWPGRSGRGGARAILVPAVLAARPRGAGAAGAGADRRLPHAGVHRRPAPCRACATTARATAWAFPACACGGRRPRRWWRVRAGSGAWPCAAARCAWQLEAHAGGARSRRLPRLHRCAVRPARHLGRPRPAARTLAGRLVLRASSMRTMRGRPWRPAPTASSCPTTAVASSMARQPAPRPCRASSTPWARTPPCWSTAVSAAAWTCSAPWRWARAA